MSPGPTFDRVYLALKEQLTSGSLAPGDHLEPAAIGEELNSSITPVRDALHRLVGEKIVEAPRNDGFRVPAPTEAELRDLYDWSDALMELALRRRPHRDTLPPFLGAGRGQGEELARDMKTAEQLFREIARRSGNPEHEAAVENLNDRLAALRVAEERLFEDVKEELAGLGALLDAQDPVALRRGIAAYHRRRQRFAPQLLLAARLPRGPQSPNNR
jgi:DNA-binding GntR family transcriptional regulator